MNRTGKDPAQPSWRIRRWFMFAVVAFCMWSIAYVLYKNLDSGPADTTVTMSFLTILGIVGSYVFGATWEDVNLAKLKTRAARPNPSAQPHPNLEEHP